MAEFKFPALSKSVDTTAPLPIGTRIANYRIVKKLASGGFSSVYLAQDPHGMAVAIKEYLPAALAYRLPGQLTPSVPSEHQAAYKLGLKCFFDEGLALAKITHPNVVRVRNFFREHQTVYMVMEYVSGQTLQDRILQSSAPSSAAMAARREQRVLSESMICRLFQGVLCGLREVHIHRLLHLDIKPGNIYLRSDEIPILLDFGAARQALVAEQPLRQAMYTPGFAAPELYGKRGQLGPWTDIYSIGAAMYACMTGMPPPDASVRQNGEDPLAERLNGLRGLYTGDLIALVKHCLQLVPEARPQSIFQLQKCLRQQKVGACAAWPTRVEAI